MSQPDLPSPPQDDMREELRVRVLRTVLPGSVAFGLIISLSAEALGWSPDLGLFGFALVALPLILWPLLHLWRRPALYVLALGYTAIALPATRWLGSPVAVCLLPVPVCLTSLLLGHWHGIANAILASIIVLFAGPWLGLPTVIARIVVVGGIWASLALVWAAIDCAAQAIDWWSASYERIRELLEDARTQRLELKQTQEDLVQANLELARISERLRAMREIAEESRRAKEEFVANVSHELRTPLNMIIGFSEMITKAPRVYGGELSPKLLADIEIILSSSRHLSSLVDDVLDLSQVDTGRMALSREWTSISEVIQAAMTAVTPLFESKNLSLEADVPDDLPRVLCDRVRIRQVILNLLSNAGRFGEHGGVRLTVERRGDELVVSVADTGPGIAPEDQHRIFEPFSQADSSIRRRYGGSGLGLAISKRFVELHEGTMWFESELGKGTTFYFTLPLQEPAAPAGVPLTRWFSPYHEYEARGRPSRAPQPALVPRFVVMEHGDTLQRLLNRYHGEVETVAVHTLEEAVAEASRLPAQALIINDPAFQDANYPAAKLAALPYGTPVVVCWVPGRSDAAEQLGLVGYLMKPVEREQLLAAVESAGKGLGRPVKTVLVVDDEPEALQLYGRILASSGRGYHVLRAPTGQRALTLMRERRPDVALLDLVMPEMDGYTLLHEKSLDPHISHIPVVALTAQDPSRGPIASSLLTVSRSGGLYTQDLLTSIDAISKILAPPDRLNGSAPSKKPRQ